MGGRMASLVADAIRRCRPWSASAIPSIRPGKPDRLRTDAPREDLRTPCLIVQGSRDPFGTREEVAGYKPSAPAVRLHWAEDGNHDLVPRKASGRSAEQTLGRRRWTPSPMPSCSSLSLDRLAATKPAAFTVQPSLAAARRLARLGVFMRGAVLQVPLGRRDPRA